MKCAVEQAQIALSIGEVPVGCVFVKDGKIIASAHNQTNITGNASRHCEMVCISELKMDDMSSIDLYVTVEPCVMCASALSLVGIKHVYFGCFNDRFGGCSSVYSIHEDLDNKYECSPGILKDEAIQLLKDFYARGNPNGVYIFYNDYHSNYK